MEDKERFFEYAENHWIEKILIKKIDIDFDINAAGHEVYIITFNNDFKSDPFLSKKEAIKFLDVYFFI